jgi:hypothetical protein
MARVRSTSRVSREGDEIEATEMAPISEVMQRSGLVVADEGTSNVKAEQTVIEGEDVESEEDYIIMIPTKPSHLDFEKSTVYEDDMHMMMKLAILERLKANSSDLLEKRLPQSRRIMKLWFSRASSERGCDFP